MRRLYLLFVLSGCFSWHESYAQDPHFSQFFAAPLSINPALTGNFYGKYIGFLNYRNQWTGPADPYKTTSALLECKFNTKPNSQKNIVGAGLSIVKDETMGGAFNSTYASLNGAYHVGFDEDGIDRLSGGIGIIYVDRRIDYSRLSFPQQFTSGGFDTNLPNGETGWSTIKPFVSFSAGVVYSHADPEKGTDLDVGVAAYHVNSPAQTAATDPKQNDNRIDRRYTGYISYSTYLAPRISLNANALYQSQGPTSYWQAGGLFSFLVNEMPEPPMLSIGGWYRNQDAVIPYLGISFRAADQVIQLGFSYDITVSQLSAAASRPRTMELSLVFRAARPDGSILCPWK